MELCIKTTLATFDEQLQKVSFNPCFNGTMYKNFNLDTRSLEESSFNPCFNGTMYKNGNYLIEFKYNYKFQSLF